jgi:hypothetical protein
MTCFVRCIDNTLAADVLSVGEMYEVTRVNMRDGYYALSGLGQFTMARFQLVPVQAPTVDASRRRRPRITATAVSRMIAA